MSDRPLISVIIPSYNYLHYITTAIDSVRAQTYPNVEILVSDNRSTDGTVDALRERYAGDPRVRIDVNDENVGMIGNFNAGFARATGAFVLWLSADDWMLPRHLERLAEVFAREPQIDVVYSGALFGTAEERVYGMRATAGQFPVDYVDARDELVEMLTTTCPLCWPTALFRRELFDELGLFDVDGPFAADWEVQVRFAAAGKRFAYLADPSMVVRTHEHQLTGGEYHTTGGTIRDYLTILERYIDHPAMSRMRGREFGIVRYLDQLVNATRALPGAAPIDAGNVARVERLSSALTRRGETYEFARAHAWRVSVIVTVTQDPVESVMRAIASIAGQTFPNVDIVVVDRGRIPLEDLLRAHPAWPSISYVRLPFARSIGAARNIGFRMARGELIAYLDPDAVMLPDHLASLVDAIARGGHEAVAASTRLVIDQYSERGSEVRIVGAAEGVYRGPGDPSQLGIVANALPLGALLAYRRLRDTAGPFNEEAPALEDFEYVLRVERATRIAFSGRTTFEAHAGIGLTGNALAGQLPSYLPMLDLIYGAYPDVLAAQPRAGHRRAVEDAIANAAGRVGNVQGLANLIGTLAGRAVFPPAAS